MARRQERGLSMIELLVGAAIGLIVVAGAGSIVAANQVDARRVQLESRLMQDLRAAAELVARDLRRAGHWAAAASGVRRGDDVVATNPHVEIAPASAASTAVALSFSTGAGDPASVDDAERFGFRLRNGAIEMQLGARNWQALSDPGTVVVTSFSVVPHVDEVELGTFCAKPCAVGSTTCPPRQQICSYAIALAGRSAVDPLVTRSLRSGVRVRNDVVVGSCEA
ncbi:MAG TPA: prepilin-type N-terminal cleavage/methylation domain-containing protein [Caldimonas sp.]|jgi:type IV pilus assembly protein PilW|nr:prepilin-type N-terminal cleavage/methylation domain-containing protein [Caldimonas sp.]